jgi:hypothetical protein
MPLTHQRTIEGEKNHSHEEREGFTVLHYDDAKLRRSAHGDEKAKRDFFSEVERNISQRLKDLRESLDF